MRPRTLSSAPRAARVSAGWPVVADRRGGAPGRDGRRWVVGCGSCLAADKLPYYIHPTRLL